MKDRALLREARLYFMPLLLGSNRLSHRLCAATFNRYGIVSLILDTKRSPRDLVSVSSHFWLLSSADSQLIRDEIISLCGQYPDALPILVPTSDEYRAIVESAADELERYMIIRSPEELLSSPPIGNMDH